MANVFEPVNCVLVFQGTVISLYVFQDQ